SMGGDGHAESLANTEIVRVCGERGREADCCRNRVSGAEVRVGLEVARPSPARARNARRLDPAGLVGLGSTLSGGEDSRSHGGAGRVEERIVWIRDVA